jgi:hypothetical protein
MPLGRSVAALIALLAALVVAGCVRDGPGVRPSEISGPLVTLETRGGECPAGACGQTTVIERDGRVHTTAPVAADLGTVPAPALEALRIEVDQADFAAIAARPFTGECPTAYDGQETIYTFGTAAGPVRLASCEVAIDEDDPLFVAALAAIRTVSP